MSAEWTQEELVQAVRARLRLGIYGYHDTPMQAMLDCDDLLVSFEWPEELQRLCLRFPVSEAPTGPSTGDECESPDEWATEVGWVLMEQLDTGLVGRARRSVTDQGFVELHHRPDR